MKKTDEQFEKNAMKYIDMHSEDDIEQELTQHEEEQIEETPVPPLEQNESIHQQAKSTTPQEDELIKKIAEDARRQMEALQNPPLNLPEEAERLRQQHLKLVETIDMEAALKNRSKMVTPESDKVFYAWLHMRFPKLFEIVEKEHQEQMEKERQILSQMNGDNETENEDEA